MHPVARVTDAKLSSAQIAVVELANAVDRLCEIATSESLDVWRTRDPERVITSLGRPHIGSCRALNHPLIKSEYSDSEFR